MRNFLKIWILVLFTVFSKQTIWAQADSVLVSKYFSTISNDENRLRQFFAEMPKGGELHNHLTGSVYAESYFNYAAHDGLWVDMATGKLYQPKDSAAGTEMVHLTPSMPDLHNTRMKLIDKWSIRNFNPDKFALGADEYFFGTFGLFGAASGKHYVELMRELRKRAASENVQYLEVMMASPHVTTTSIDEMCGKGFYDRFNGRLEQAIATDAHRIKGRETTEDVLQEIFTKWNKSKTIQRWVKQYVLYVDSIDKCSELPVGSHDSPTCYYQGYASRNSAPLLVYAQLYASFKSCLQSGSKIVGVNIVSAENGEVSMSGYTAHMKMFRCLQNNFKTHINKSLHAGEMTLSLVKPEEMRHHIREAVFVAGANRIGHGVDVAFEQNSISLLDTMRMRQIPIEINLTSNEFILGVKGDLHPFMLYRQAGVPIILSTDDPGILRTNLTQQYVLATLRYGLTYYEIKQIVRNSIRFGFMPNGVKERMMQQVETRFSKFEETWRSNIETMDRWKK